MENASKALIMAGAILIAIMIVSLGIMIFSNMSNSAKNAANMDEQEIANFNAKITPYTGESVSGSQVNALIQLVISIDNNAISSGELGRAVSITYPATSGGTNTISAGKTEIQYSAPSATRKVETGKGKYYKVNADYGSNGLINQITVTI